LTLFMVIGNSGAGKTSLMREVAGIEHEIVSVTTRRMRAGEEQGVGHYFISEREYNNLYSAGQFVAYSMYAGESYGVTKDELTSKLSTGFAYAVVDHTGYKQLKRYCFNNRIHAISILLYNSKLEAESIMRDRGDAQFRIERRLVTHAVEVETGRAHHDFVIYNPYGRAEMTKQILRAIINGYTGRVEP